MTPRPHQNLFDPKDFSSSLETDTNTTTIVQSLEWSLPFDIFGRNIENFIFSIGANNNEGNSVPDAISHPGIIVFGCMYEYGDFGIIKIPARRASKLHSQPEVETVYGVTAPTPRQNLGTTTKTFQEFEKWIRAQSNGKFEINNYNMVNNNCLNFAMDACTFLGVNYPENWEKICFWLQVNKFYMEKFGRVSVIGRNIYYKLKKGARNPWSIIDFVQKRLIVSSLHDSSQ